MKKLSIALLILLVLISSAAQADVMKHVADQANTFTDREIEKLEARMTGIYDVYGFDTVIVTTRDSRGQTAQMYAADFYDEFRDYDAYPNGLIFSFNFDIGEYYEATRGLKMELFSDQNEGALDSLLRAYLNERDYYGAMNAYLDEGAAASLAEERVGMEGITAEPTSGSWCSRGGASRAATPSRSSTAAAMSALRAKRKGWNRRRSAE